MKKVYITPILRFGNIHEGLLAGSGFDPIVDGNDEGVGSGEALSHKGFLDFEYED